MTFANNLSEFGFVPHSCVTAAKVDGNGSNTHKLGLAAARRDDFSTF